MVTRWRLRCQHLEEQLEDTTAALRRSEAARLELSLDYKHALDKLWRQERNQAPVPARGRL